MKKVMIFSAVILALSYATPQVASAMKVQNESAFVQDKEVKYTEVKVEEVPEAVNKAIIESYAGFTIEKALLGDDGTYKVKVTKGDKKQVLFYTANGDLIKAEESAKKAEEPVK